MHNTQRNVEFSLLQHVAYNQTAYDSLRAMSDHPCDTKQQR